MAELIRRHYGASLRVARAILHDQTDAEDAVQSTYGLAFQHLHTFLEQALFSTWITRIVINQSLMELRRRRRATLLNLEEPIHPRRSQSFTSRVATPEQITAGHEISTAISRAIAKLPLGLRMAYKLHALSGLSIAEVADALGLSVSAAKSRIFRARCTLASRLYVRFGLAPFSLSVGRRFFHRNLTANSRLRF